MKTKRKCYVAIQFEQGCTDVACDSAPLQCWNLPNSKSAAAATNKTAGVLAPIPERSPRTHKYTWTNILSSLSIPIIDPTTQSLLGSGTCRTLRLPPALTPSYCCSAPCSCTFPACCLSRLYARLACCHHCSSSSPTPSAADPAAVAAAAPGVLPVLWWLDGGAPGPLLLCRCASARKAVSCCAVLLSSLGRLRNSRVLHKKTEVDTQRHRQW